MAVRWSRLAGDRWDGHTSGMEADPPNDIEAIEADAVTNAADAEAIVDTDDDVGSSTVEPPDRDGSTDFIPSRSNQAVAGTIAAVVIVLSLLQWGRLSGWGMRPVEITELTAIENRFKLDINTATAIEWSQLDRIGEVLANRIVEDRKANGNFESIDDLTRVEGIGPQTLEQIRQWLTVKQND